jgi:hypothetical protein
LAAFVTSLFVSEALSNGVGLWDGVAVILLFGLGVLIAFMLWSYHRYRFRFDPAELLRLYVDGEASVSLSAMHRSLALRIEADRASNWRIMGGYPLGRFYESRSRHAVEWEKS